MGGRESYDLWEGKRARVYGEAGLARTQQKCGGGSVHESIFCIPCIL